MMTGNTENLMPKLICSVMGSAYEIRISNPARRNALTLQMWRDLASQVREAALDENVRVVIVRGDGDQAFSSGADISEFRTLRSTPEQVVEYGLAVDDVQHALTRCEKPTIALIQGVCMGGGMEIAAACDIRYASESARFRMPAGLVGLAYPVAGVARMVDVIGASRAADILMTSRTFDGLEAARIGLVQEAFPEDEYELRSAERVDAVTGSAPLSLKATKLMLRHLSNEEAPPDTQELERVHDACFASRDYIEGQQAFKEKRKPIFRGV